MPDKLENLKMEFAGRFASIAQEQRPDMVVDTIDNLFAAINQLLEQEKRKAVIAELRGLLDVDNERWEHAIHVDIRNRIAELEGKE